MEQCRAAEVGPQELDLAGHGGRREEEEGGEAARRRGSGGTYRPESTWVKGVASGGGGFGSGAHDGERAERAGGAAHGGAAWQLGRAPGTRAIVGRCQGPGQVALEGFPGSIWPWTRRGRGPPAAYGRAAAKQRGEREIGTHLQISKVQGPPGKLKLSPS